MADTITNGKTVQVTLSLADPDDLTEATTTRSFSVEVLPTDTWQTAKTRVQAFQTNYMANFANYEGADGTVGSILQRTGWRDTDNNETALVCIGMKFSFTDKSVVDYDL